MGEKNIYVICTEASKGSFRLPSDCLRLQISPYLNPISLLMEHRAVFSPFKTTFSGYNHLIPYGRKNLGKKDFRKTVSIGWRCIEISKAIVQGCRKSSERLLFIVRAPAVSSTYGPGTEGNF